jgi:thiol-disulfide isomerase/thioredoxin
MSAASLERRLTADTNTYRYQRFTTSLLFRDLRFHKNTAGPGDVLPPFELVTTGGGRMVNRDVFDDKPVLFIFGSMTCPNTASAAPSVQTLYKQFGDRVRFIMVYVREAHPGEYISQAETIEEKLEHARALKEFYDIEWTVAADNIEGDLHRALDPKPNSAVLMNSAGIILFRSLWTADRDAMHQALHAAAAGRAPELKQSSALIGPVTRAMGQVQAVMERGGPQAVRDLWIAGFPIALAGRVATLFSPLSPDQRGIAAVLTLAFGTLAGLGIWAAVVFS